MTALLASCADASVPGTRHVNIPTPATAKERKKALNEKPDSVLYLPLGEDVLLPHTVSGDPLPDEIVGPFELRSETLAGALQLILADYDIPMAFQTEKGLTQTVTVANMHGPLSRIVSHVCGLANLYCSYEDGILVVKEMQTFTVSIPPVTSGETDIIDAVATGLQAITGLAPVIDKGTRTIVYTATQRTAEMAERYFQRMRANTALIIFEIYIWEVALTAGNATGIDWENMQDIGKFNTGISFTGGAGATNATPISIGLPTMGPVSFGTNDVLQFISEYGAVKTISQPQIAVLSGAKASLRVADTVNYVSSLERTVDNGEVSVSTETDSVDTGFTMSIGSAWDNATIYGTIEINLQEFRKFTEFDADGTTLKLPETTERELKTQIRIRPGDSLLIAGLVRENDEYNSSGPGFMNPIFPTSRDASTGNVELVFLLRPRVVVYTSKDAPRPAPVRAIRTGQPFGQPVPPAPETPPLSGGRMTDPDAPLPPSRVPAPTTLVPPVSSVSPMQSSGADMAAIARQLDGLQPAAGMPILRMDKVSAQALSPVEEEGNEALDSVPEAALPPLLPDPPKPSHLTYGASRPVYTQTERPAAPPHPTEESSVGSVPHSLFPVSATTPSETIGSIHKSSAPLVFHPRTAPLPEPAAPAPVLLPPPSEPVREEREPIAVSTLPVDPNAARAPTPLAPSSIPLPPNAASPEESESDYAPSWKNAYPDVDAMNPYLRKLREP
jgi:MSHA biogenesis protein MshL